MKKARKLLGQGLLLSALLIGLVGPIQPATAGTMRDGVRVFLGPETIIRGYTIKTPSEKLVVGIFPNVLDRPALVTLKESWAGGTIMPSGWKMVSPVYEFDILTDPIKIFAKEVAVQLDYDSDTQNRRELRFWDGNLRAWRTLYSVDLTDRQAIRAFTHLPYSRIAVFEQGAYEGAASWYRSSKVMAAASNDFPLGSKIKVTAENGKSVVVTVVSRGPYVAGRVVDLSTDAFSQLVSLGAGVVKVSVTQYYEPAAPPVTAQPAPSVTAASALVLSIDPVTKETRTIFEKNPVQRPLASITKLMTAMVVLETGPDFNRSFAYDSDDNASGSAIHLEPGETLTINDYFKASLTASANNATKTLARSTGLSKEEFVRRMNEAARRLGMTDTRFVEPTGLESENVSTARDVAKLVDYIMNRNGLRVMTVTGTDTVKTQNTGRVITLYNTNHILNRGLPIFGGKTGYLGVGQANFALKFVQGDKWRIVVILGSTDGSSRNEDMVRLGNWALSQ